MRTLAIILISLISIPAMAKKQDIEVSLHNSTSDTIKVYMVVSKSTTEQGENAFDPETIFPGKTLKKTIIVERYSFVRAWGEPINKGGRTKIEQSIIQKGDDKFSRTLAYELDPNNQKDVVSLSSLSNKYKFDPSFFYDKKETNPKPISALFNRHLGGIIAYREEGDSIIIERTVSPVQLGTENNIKYGTLTSTDEYLISSETNQEIGSSIPVVGTLGIDFVNSNTYQIKLSYRGMGVIEWEDNGVNIDDAFYSLNEKTLYNIGELRTRYPNLKLDVIDKAFVFDGIFAEVTRMNKLATKNEINASTFFNNAGFFKKETKSLSSETYGSSYLGFWTTGTMDLTGGLDRASYVYYSKESQLLAFKSNEEVISYYNDLKSTNPDLPNLVNKSQILDYFKSEKAQIMEQYDIPQNIDNQLMNNLRNIDPNTENPLLNPDNSQFENLIQEFIQRQNNSQLNNNILNQLNEKFKNQNN